MPDRFKSIDRVIDATQQKFYGTRVLVVGDVMLDRYIWGRVDRISPEAPVPVVRSHHTTQTAGGAANVAINLVNLGCNVSLCGITGADVEADIVLRVLRESTVNTSAMVALANRPTTVKTRIIGGHQQMLRVDTEDSRPISESDTADVIRALHTAVSKDLKAIVLSDYAKGLLSGTVCQNVIKSARDLGIPVLVDPKGLDYRKYAGATAISPNQAEMAAATHGTIDNLAALLAEGEELRSALGLDFIALTLGDRGITLLEPAEVTQFPATAREVFDVSGAGDTVIGTLAAAIAVGIDLHDAVRLANLAAGIVVGKVGTAGVTQQELLAELVKEAAIGNRLCSREQLLSRVARWRAKGERVVFTNGCFDILHVGHITLLEKARREGSRLVVGLNTDRSVRALKGPKRPLCRQDDRARVLAALACVDAVVLFDEDTPLELIQLVRPDVLVKGGDYAEEQIVGAREVRTWGGRVAIVPLVQGASTTQVLKRATEAGR